MPRHLDDAAMQQLRTAKEQLEATSFAVRLADKVGSPLEKSLAMLPTGASEMVNEAVTKSLTRATDVAIRSLDLDRSESGTAPSNRLHKALAAGSGAVGGAFGFAGFAAELPVSTMLMLRSIADIARANHEDLSDPAARLSCVEVFAFGGPGEGDDGAETGYFAIRQALGASISQAASHIARHGATTTSAPALARFISAIAGRFSLTASEKLAAQMVPIVGALGGATINTMFITHYQSVAGGHFGVRQLERTWGSKAVQKAYESIDLGATRTDR